MERRYSSAEVLQRATRARPKKSSALDSIVCEEEEFHIRDENEWCPSQGVEELQDVESKLDRTEGNLRNDLSQLLKLQSRLQTLARSGGLEIRLPVPQPPIPAPKLPEYNYETFVGLKKVGVRISALAQDLSPQSSASTRGRCMSELKKHLACCMKSSWKLSQDKMRATGIEEADRLEVIGLRAHECWMTVHKILLDYFKSSGREAEGRRELELIQQRVAEESMAGSSLARSDSMRVVQNAYRFSSSL